MKRYVASSFLFFSAFAPAFASQASMPAPVAVSYAIQTGAAERIESGDLLRVYTQEVAAAACFLHNEIDMALSKKLLTEARDGFRLHLDALRNGNEQLGIPGAEERRKTVAKIDAVQASWAPLETAVGALLADHKNQTAVATIKDGNLDLLKQAETLLADLQGEYTNPVELLQSDALLLEIAGRQSLMTQKIAKNACKLVSGRDTDKVRADLSEAIGIYELSLNALLNGMQQLGIKPAPTPEIADALRSVQNDWAKTKPVVDNILSGSHKVDDLKYLFEHMTEEMHKLEEITHMYAVFSKHDY